MGEIRYRKSPRNAAGKTVILAEIGEDHTLLERANENLLVFSKISPDIDKILYR